MPRMSKLSSYKTTIAHDEGFTKVTYHSTVIVKWNSREIVLNSGGWKTVTTLRKMRQAATQFNLGYSIYCKQGEWTVEYGGKTVLFQDGMKLKRVKELMAA